MPKYQVQYKHKSHTYTSDIEADSVDNVYNLFNEMSVAEILEIRRYVYESRVYKKDDGDYVKGISFSFSNNVNQSCKFSLKKIKSNLSVRDIILYIRSFLKFKNSTDFNISSIKFS